MRQTEVTVAVEEAEVAYLGTSICATGLMVQHDYFHGGWQSVTEKG